MSLPRLSEMPPHEIRPSGVMSSWKLHPSRRASEESTTKVQKASTHVSCGVGVDVGIPYCHCASLDVHPTALPNKESACVWSILGTFLRRGALEESTRKVQKASTHKASSVGVDVGLCEVHITTVKINSTSLQAATTWHEKQAPHRGLGKMV